MSSRGKKKTIESGRTKSTSSARELWWNIHGKKAIILGVVALCFLTVMGVAIAAGGSFDNTSDKSLPTLLDLGSSGCPACDDIRPIIDELKSQYKGKINVNFYDVNNSSTGKSLANTYGVTSIPTLVYVNKNGTVVKKTVGYKSKSEIIAVFRELGWI